MVQWPANIFCIYLTSQCWLAHIWLVVCNMFFICFHILGIVIPTDSYFSEGLLNHQPVSLSKVFNQQHWWYFRERDTGDWSGWIMKDGGLTLGNTCMGNVRLYICVSLKCEPWCNMHTNIEKPEEHHPVLYSYGHLPVISTYNPIYNQL